MSSFISSIDLQLVQNTFQTFKNIQSSKNCKDLHRKNNSKLIYKEALSQYSIVLKEILDDLACEKVRLESILIKRGSLNDNDQVSRTSNDSSFSEMNSAEEREQPGGDSGQYGLRQYQQTNSEIRFNLKEATLNYDRLLTYQQLLSLAGIIFFQLEVKNTSPGPVFSAWANLSYKEIISDMIINLEGFGGTVRNYFSTIAHCILTARISDTRNMLKIFKSKIPSNNFKIIEAYNSVDQLMQLDVVLSDSTNFNVRMEQLQRTAVQNLLVKLVGEYKEEGLELEEGRQECVERKSEVSDEIIFMPLLVLKFLNGSLGEERVGDVFNNSNDEVASNTFLAPWFFEFLYEIMFKKPNVKLYQLTPICENLVYTYRKQENGSYSVLEVLTIRLVSLDIIGFCDTFCQSNECWLVAFLIIDLLYHSNIHLPDCPNPEEFFYKRRQIGLELTKSITNKPSNLPIILDYLINILDDDIEIITAIEKIITSKFFIENSDEKEKIKIYHILLNHKKLPSEVAFNYCAKVGSHSTRTFPPTPNVARHSLQWSIRSNQTPQVESQILKNVISKSDTFQQLLQICEEFADLHFNKITPCSSVVEGVLKYRKSTDLRDLLSVLNSDCKELKIGIKMDILSLIQNSFERQDQNHNQEVGILKNNFDKADLISLMRLANNLQRSRSLDNNDGYKKFLVKLVSKFGSLLSST